MSPVAESGGDAAARGAAAATTTTMTNTINSAYPWGRSFDEYRRMFRLSEEDLSRPGGILGCADGPAAFNAAMRAMGRRRVVSCDPLYQFGADEIRARIE